MKAFEQGIAFSLGYDFIKGFLRLTNVTAYDSEQGMVLIRQLANDRKEWKEELHRRDDRGRFALMGYANTHSALYHVVKDKNGKKAKGEEVTDKERFINSLPDYGKSKKGVPLSQALKPFAKVKAYKHTKLSQFDKDLYLRGNAIKYEGKRPGDAPAYEWMQNGKRVSDKRAVEIETVLRSYGCRQALTPASTDVKVRPDLATGKGQLVTSNTKKSSFIGYDLETAEAVMREKYDRVSRIIDNYPKIANAIIDDCIEGRKEAPFAYFMHQTLARIGSSSESEGKGILQLHKSNFYVADGTVFCNFHGKNGFWRLVIKDPFLSGWLQGRLSTMKKGDKVFDCSYYKATQYLAEIGKRAGDIELHAHDFRRAVGTQVARAHIDANLTKEILADEKRYSKLVVQAINKASKAINDTASVAFEHYIVPQILFKEKPELAEKYTKAFARMGVIE